MRRVFDAQALEARRQGSYISQLFPRINPQEIKASKIARQRFI
jgi:hypothetical protein